MNTNTNTTEVVKANFELGYGNLPAVMQIPVKTSIMKECGWSSLVTFHNKRKGITKIRPTEVLVIEAHFKKHGINPWTGLPFFDENF